MRPHQSVILTALSAVLSLLPTPLLAQNISVDEGAFRIYLNGKAAGREEFSIRRTGVGDQARVILRGTVDLDLPEGTVHLAPAMEARGRDLRVATYQIKVSGAETTEVFVSLAERRYMARILSASGERLREFRAGPGSVLLDEGVAHQHFLLLPFLDSGSGVSVTVLVPRAVEQLRLTLTPVGEEEMRVGEGLVKTRRFRLGDGPSAREVWFDDQNRIVRVEVPSVGYVAERESLS